jgi:hypothetical protein
VNVVESLNSAFKLWTLKVFCMICRLRLYWVTCGSSGKRATVELDQLQLLAWLGKVGTVAEVCFACLWPRLLHSLLESWEWSSSLRRRRDGTRRSCVNKSWFWFGDVNMNESEWWMVGWLVILLPRSVERTNQDFWREVSRDLGGKSNLWCW